MSTRTVDFDLELDFRQPFQVVAAKINEGISEVTHAIVEIASAEDLDLERVLMADAVLTLMLDRKPSRWFTLKVGQAGYVAALRGSLRYRIDLYSHVWSLRFTTNTRKFRDMTTQAIVSKILGECGVPHRWALVRDTPVRSYCVQYRETNLAFVERLLEFEGIYHTLDSDGVLVLADRSSTSPAISGRVELELIDAAGALAGSALGIHELRCGARVASGAVTVNDFDWKKPKLDLLQSANADSDGELATYDYPTGYRDPGVGAYLAKIRLEAQRVPSRYVRGRANVDGFAPAYKFTFGASGGDGFAGEYLLVSIEHDMHNPAYVESAIAGMSFGSVTYENRFQAIPLNVPFRPALRTPQPTIGGSHTAIVRGPIGEEIHTDRYGRFKAQFHWDREAEGTDKDSRWMRVLQESASGMVLARVGWEMSISYIDGDPDRPIGIARHINGVMPPTYAQPASKNVMTIRTPSSPSTGGYNEVRLDDTLGAMGFHVRAERDFIGVVKNDRTEKIGVDETHVVDMSVSHAVERDQTVTIGGSSLTQAAHDYRLHVKKHRTKTVAGSETVKVGADANATTQGNEAETVGSVRVTACGSVTPPDFKSMLKSVVPNPEAVLQRVAHSALASHDAPRGVSDVLNTASDNLKSMIPTPAGTLSTFTSGLSEGVTMGKLVDMLCHGEITRTAERSLSRTVGGALVQAGVGSIATNVKTLYTETVGGAKITIAAKGNITTTVNGPAALTVGGVLMRKSKKSMGFAAKNTRVNIGGLARLSSNEKIEMRGNHIVIEARSSLTLKTPNLEIALTPTKTTIKGDLKLDAKQKVEVAGMDDNLT